jgi:hypothetical protein
LVDANLTQLPDAGAADPAVQARPPWQAPQGWQAVGVQGDGLRAAMTANSLHKAGLGCAGLVRWQVKPSGIC